MLIACRICNAQAPAWQWAKSAIGDSGEVAQAIATDNYGNIYVTGTFTSPIVSFGTITLFNSGDEDIFVAKYDPNGNPLWAKSAGGTYWDRSTSITVDPSDNIFVTGYFESDTLYFDTDTLVNLYYGSDLFIAKYDSSGNVLWAKRDGIGASQANAITNDLSGNVYITGSYYSAIIVFGSDTLTNLTLGSNGTDVFTLKYDSSGNVLWARGGRGLYQDEAISIATDNNGSLYITGRFGSLNLSFDTLVLHNNGLGYTDDIFIVKYDTSGNVIWAKNEGGISADNPMSIVTDNYGNLYLTGHFHSSSIIFGSDTLLNNTIYYSKTFLAKFDTSGNVIWAKAATGNPGGDGAFSVSVDNIGNVYIAGGYGGINSSITFDSITIINSAAPYSDIFVVKYNDNGNVQWVKSASGNTNDDASSIVFDNSGSIYVAGSFESNAITFDSYVIPNSNPGCNGTFTCYDMFLAKLNATTGINENGSSNVTNIFPNPVSDKLTVTINNKLLSEIILYDITSRKLLQQAFTNSVTLNTARLAKGIYVYEVRNNKGEVKKGKVIKD
jgi:hypothetical protein